MAEGGGGMWPKLLMQYLPQLVELLPHMRRMVPMADKMMEGRAAREAKLDELAAGLRGDLGKVAKAHVEMATHLDGFAGHVAGIEREARAATAAAQMAGREAERARVATEAIEGRLTRLEKGLALQRTLAFLLLLLLLVVAVLLVVVLLRQH